MATSIATRLKKLAKTSHERGLHAVAIAAQAAAGDPDNLDLQINLIGALHEAGKLRNSLEPYWKVWREDPAPWCDRCIARLVKECDHDSWAVAALLGVPASAAIDALDSAGWQRMALRQYQPLGRSPMTVLTVALEVHGSIWVPVLEIGYESESFEVVDVTRCRAVSFPDTPERQLDSFFGAGSATCFLRASLPHGNWRLVDADFELPREAIVEGLAQAP